MKLGISDKKTSRTAAKRHSAVNLKFNVNFAAE